MQGLETTLEAVANRVQSLEEVVLLLRQTTDLDPDPVISRIRWEAAEGNASIREKIKSSTQLKAVWLHDGDVDTQKEADAVAEEVAIVEEVTEEETLAVETETPTATEE